ncbi:MAG: hypothetical protein UX89_C0001G0027 [Parcubacteria group bacterium GW2011_GWA2_47_16]|nr:MAG: hypothetical protein UX89_C0001G0027 [Parcubacteria group bacterium GW2011_GWA2_47_16]
MDYKEKIKKIPFAGKKLVGIYSWYLRLKNGKFLKKNLELKNKFAGKRCFVIATGPSINKQDLKQLAGEISISVSNFFLHPDFNIVKPTYHLFVPSHLPVTVEQYGAAFKDAEAHFSAGQNILVSISDKHIVEKFEVFKKQNIYYYFIRRKPLGKKETIDFSKPLPFIQTSVHIGMYLGIYIGAAEICLLGCDHDWILHMGETRHFYDEKNSALSKAGYNEWSGGMEHQFESYLNLWRVYKAIRDYSAKPGIKIYNLSPMSILDVFPKADFDEKLRPPQS